MLGLVVRLKIPGLSDSIRSDYVNLAIDLLYNSPSELVKLAALKFVVLLFLVFPVTMGEKAVELRDISRFYLLLF